MKRILLYILVIISQSALANPIDSTLVLHKKIFGDIRPKSIVYSGRNLFFAQNMMYRHSITVYNREGKLQKTISDHVTLSDYGIEGYSGEHRGAPVEAAFSPNGRYAWVSNYQMFGDEFDSPGTDKCKSSAKYDSSFVYKINTQSFEIEALVKVGCVPKYVSTTPNGRYVLVTNWCSGDMSVIDPKTNQEIRRVTLARYPRGIAVDANSKYAFVAIMSSAKLAVVDLDTWEVKYIRVGIAPRHICISPDNRFLYVTLNSEGMVAKVDLESMKMIKKVKTGRAPRSMSLSTDGKALYVVNYLSNTVSKVKTEDMTVVCSLKTGEKPIGITVDTYTGNVWVACYVGAIWIFEDRTYKGKKMLPGGLPLAPANQISFEKYFLTYIIDIDGWIEEDKKTSEKPSEAPKVEKKQTEEASSGYCVIVGSFSTKENAQKRLLELQKQAIETVVMSAGKGKYRLRTPFYASRTEAEKQSVILGKQLQVEAWVLFKK